MELFYTMKIVLFTPSADIFLMKYIYAKECIKILFFSKTFLYLSIAYSSPAKLCFSLLVIKKRRNLMKKMRYLRGSSKYLK